MGLEAEIRMLLSKLGFDLAEYSNDLAYILRTIYSGDELLDQTVLVMLEENIRIRNSYRFA